MRNQYRAPAGHRPYIHRTGNHGGQLAGLCAVIMLGGMVLLSLLALDRVASAPAAHPAPAHHLDILDDPHPQARAALLPLPAPRPVVAQGNLHPCPTAAGPSSPYARRVG